jgi:hypothetical protein
MLDAQLQVLRKACRDALAYEIDVAEQQTMTEAALDDYVAVLERRLGLPSWKEDTDAPT